MFMNDCECAAFPFAFPDYPTPGKDSPNCFKNCFKFLNPALQGPPGSASNVQKEQETCRLTVYTEIYWE